MIIAMEADAYHLPSGTVKTLYFSEAGFTTRPDDMPPNVYFDPVIKTPPTLDRLLFDGAATSGATKVTVGNVLLVNEDGHLDALATDYAFSGRRFVVKMSDDVETPYAEWTVVMTGTLSDVSVQDSGVSIVIEDRLADLTIGNRPKYLGNNVLPDGIEGTKDDLKDRVKPRVYGAVQNVSALCVNTSKLIYQVSDAACTVSAAYDNGVALTRATDYASVADMLATAPAAGSIRCFAGYFRLGAAPVGTVTCDASSSAVRAADILLAIAHDAAVPDADLSLTDAAALNATNGATVGVWADSDATPQELMDLVAGSIGAWYGFDRLSRLRMGRLEAPAGSPRATWGQETQMALSIRYAGVPAWSVTINYARNYTVQTDVAGSAARTAAWLALEYRSSVQDDATIKVPWPHADELSFDTGLSSESDAVAESQRRLALYGTRRLTLDVDIPVSELGAVDLGDVVALDTPRFGLQGKLLRVIGINSGFAHGRAALVLWG
ncbi:hypothetical protein [Caballeronia sp. AZ7_KS35]|uniref:hypothetical protein n=1 Tax=Caballeronia sp. AZ7_KS35 TaxID=2921762 RepID=UPI00202779C9|nr:hypothetical protein [Caballeronia sp. AZ7_KS35]